VLTLAKRGADAVVSPVRQGRVVAHLTATGLVWTRADGSTAMPSSIEAPQWWVEVEVWATTVSLQLGWEELGVGSGCAVCGDGTLRLALTVGGVLAASAERAFTAGAQVDYLPLLFENAAGGVSSAGSAAHPVAVTSAAGTITARDATFADTVLEVPVDTATCAYGVACDALPAVDFAVSNPNEEAAVVRLSLSRNYPDRAAHARSAPGAEASGLGMVIRDASGQPTGLPFQVSLKRDVSVLREVYECGYATGGNGAVAWWTVSVLLRLPPLSDFSGSFALVYGRYGGVPAASVGQLSLTGVVDSWVWHQGSLGSLGANDGVDTLGLLARSQLASARVELFDGNVTRDVGGGDFLVYFNASGSYVFPKAAEATVVFAGPCLSTSTYTQESQDGAIALRLTAQLPRSDDYARQLLHFRYDVRRDTTFSRLALFQAGADHNDRNGAYSHLWYA